MTITNSILANDFADCEANSSALGTAYSLFEHTDAEACGLVAANPDGNGNIVGESAVLGTLGNYGGSTLTLPPT